MKHKIAILGCGAIFSRHVAAIKINAEHYILHGVYDIKHNLAKQLANELAVKQYTTEADVYADPAIDYIAILTPSNLHYQQALTALKHNKNVILEKPATFLADELQHLVAVAKEHNVNIFGVLQVRLNPAVMIAKRAIAQGLLGQIRGVSLVQRWQRPLTYFTGWRGTMVSGGGILREFAIHYLDVMQYLVGVPKVLNASCYNSKFNHTNVSDTIYALFDFDTFGGTMEISIAAEPRNLECTLAIMGANGFLKLGGKSLDEIVVSDFLTETMKDNLMLITEEVNKLPMVAPVNQGASPYHPELYHQIIIDPERFSLEQMYSVTKLIAQVYSVSLQSGLCCNS